MQATDRMRPGTPCMEAQYAAMAGRPAVPAVEVAVTVRRVIGSALWLHVADDQIDRYTRMLVGYGLLGVDNIRLSQAISL